MRSIFESFRAVLGSWSIDGEEFSLRAILENDKEDYLERHAELRKLTLLGPDDLAKSLRDRRAYVAGHTASKGKKLAHASMSQEDSE